MLPPPVARGGLAEARPDPDALSAGVAGSLKPIHHERASGLGAPFAL
jgi:hypothetical protein